MKKNSKWIVMGIFSLLAYSCSKNRDTIGLPNNSAALTVVNLINGSNGIITNFSPSGPKGETDTLQYYSSAAQIYYGSFLEFSSYSGSQLLSIVSLTDTLTSEWSGPLTLPVGGISSLYFAGPDTLHIDTLLTTDNPPNYPIGDSSVGVRFIHLAQQTNPVLVDIQGGNDTLVESLAYKGVTRFLTLPATSTNPSGQQYMFEFRDQLNGNILATYSYSYFYLFKSITVVLSGEGSAANWNAVEVNDF